MILISLDEFKLAYSLGETGIINILKPEEDSKDGRISCKNFKFLAILLILFNTTIRKCALEALRT